MGIYLELDGQEYCYGGPEPVCFGIPVRINVMVKVRSKESERELRASESKRARRIEALDLRSCTARYHAEGKAGTRRYFVRVELDGEWMESLYR